MIIAEIGLNHLGDKEYAVDYVERLLSTSVDAITFQVREASFYQRKEKKSLELPIEFYKDISLVIKNAGKKFGVALCNTDLFDYFDKFVDFYKILSKDLGNDSFINIINNTDKKIFLSTGLSSFDQIKSFTDRIDNEKRSNTSLIHTQLSNLITDVNLKAINSMKENFEFPISFGNHCENPKVIYLSLSFEPHSIFIYVKGDLDIVYPDEKHAVCLKDLTSLVDDINELRLAVGKGVKNKMYNKIKGQK